MISNGLIGSPFLKFEHFSSTKTKKPPLETLNVPLGYFINDTSMTSVGNKLAVNKAMINEIEQMNVTK